MRAIVAERPGLLSQVLSVLDVDEPSALDEGEVVVSMLASTVNPSDAVTISGAYGSRTAFPFVPGFEGVGVIERAGVGVPDTAIGQRVLPIGSPGNWQQRRRTDYSWCVPVPDDLSDEVACFAYINPLTAHLMVERFCTDRVHNVAITAATSTIASHLAELLNQRGIAPIGLVRGTPGRTVADSARWRAVVDISDATWPQLLRAESGGGVDLFLDSVGGPQGLEFVRQLTPGGTLVHYGLLSGEPLPAGCFDGHRGTRVVMFRLRDIVHAHPREQAANLFRPVFDHLREGRLRTPIAERIGLGHLPGALQAHASGRLGKIMILTQE